MAVVLDALGSYVHNMLTEMAKEEIHMLVGVAGEIQKLDDKLKGLKDILADADRRNITDLTVQALVRKLRLVMYDATDILDLCQLKAMEQGPSRDMGCFNPLLFCMKNPLHAHDIGRRIKNLNQRLDSIKEESTTFNFTNIASYQDHSRKVESSRLACLETSGELDESGMVGEKIEEDTRNLVELLTKEDKTINGYNKIMVFAIVGVGGIGKTTLAQKIFNNDIIKKEFKKKLWLSVNKDFNKNDLLRRAIIEAGGDQQKDRNTMTALVQTLKETFKGHKALLVMDDVWDHRAWEDVLKTPLANSLAPGSRVLVTTRHDAVARGMMAMEPYHRVDKLEPEDAWSLLRMQVVRNGNDEPHIEMLKDIGMRIIANCDCLPLAVRAMGGLLRQKKTRRGEWENVLKDFIWSASEMPEELNHAIYLSYHDLQPSLKTCFLHFSLLPKRIYFVEVIVGMWISEGIIHGHPSDDLEELGRKYYDELIERNLIEPNGNYLDQWVCNMHDVVRSFAHYVARDEALVAQNGEIGILSKLNRQNLIRLSLEANGSDDLEWSSLQEHISLRTLILVGQVKFKLGDSLACFSSLRTLHIEDAEIDPLTESLYHLKHLRYLSIQNTDTSILPENIGKMKFLQYISLLGCESLTKLPDCIGKLQQLRHLTLTGTSINNVPRGFDGLINMRKLYGFPAQMDGDWCSLEELGPLSQLIELRISGLENVSSSSFAIKARIREKVHLSYLSLSCTSRIRDGDRLVKEEEGISEEEQQRIEEVFDELYPPHCLENLNIEGYFGRRLPRWVTTAVPPFGSLRILTIEDLPCCTELPDGLCRLPCLEQLHIDNAPVIKHVGPEFLQPCHRHHSPSQVAAGFPSLLSLYFVGMMEWEDWEWEEKVKAMPVLELLHLDRCKLRRVPPGLPFHARALKKLFVSAVMHLSSLENFASVVLLHLCEVPDLERISDMPKLQKLIISLCPKMKVVEGVPALQRLVLDDFDMKSLPRYLQYVKPRYLRMECTLELLTSIAAGKSSPEWDKFSHIQQVKAYAYDYDDDNHIRIKWYVLYTVDPFSFETNISSSAITKGCRERAGLARVTCPIEEEWPVGRPYAEKRQPLCLRFRWNAQRHLVGWFAEACLHCAEAAAWATSSDQWIEAKVARSVLLLCAKQRGGDPDLDSKFRMMVSFQSALISNVGRPPKDFHGAYALVLKFVLC
ncbi:hypothetical protein ACP70R_003996 [Stipagrostis hirtigluma subsp. patula]